MLSSKHHKAIEMLTLIVILTLVIIATFATAQTVSAEVKLFDELHQETDAPEEEKSAKAQDRLQPNLSGATPVDDLCLL